jgi:HK97 family phage prohead protease
MDLEQQFMVDRVEARSVTLTDVEVAQDGRQFSGYAALFGQHADLGDFTEEIRRGAFRKVLNSGANVPMYWDHDPRVPPLATTRSGTLRLSEDTRGLKVEADLDDDHYMTPTLRSMIRRGDVTGMSFGFVAGRGNQLVEERNGRPHRILTNFKNLLDVSPTWNPAYEGTSAELRSALAEIRSAYAASTGVYADPLEQRGHGQRIVAGEEPQRDEGAPADVSEPLDDQQEQRSDTDWEIQAAARARRLRLLGMQLPKQH